MMYNVTVTVHHVDHVLWLHAIEFWSPFKCTFKCDHQWYVIQSMCVRVSNVRVSMCPCVPCVHVSNVQCANPYAKSIRINSMCNPMWKTNRTQSYPIVPMCNANANVQFHVSMWCSSCTQSGTNLTIKNNCENYHAHERFDPLIDMSNDPCVHRSMCPLIQYCVVNWCNARIQCIMIMMVIQINQCTNEMEKNVWQNKLTIIVWCNPIHANVKEACAKYACVSSRPHGRPYRLHC